MASDFGTWFHIALVGLVCVQGSEANGRRVAVRVVSVPKSGLIFAGNVESPLLLLLLSLHCEGEALSYRAP